MIKLRTLAALLMLGCFYLGCTKAVIDEGNPSPIEELVKYNPDINTLMTAQCTNCHSGNNPPAGVNLETYENVKFYTADGQLINRIKDGANSMPPNGLMSADKIQLIEKWKTDGFLEN